jgi:hypothetical protein
VDAVTPIAGGGDSVWASAVVARRARQALGTISCFIYNFLSSYS